MLLSSPHGLEAMQRSNFVRHMLPLAGGGRSRTPKTNRACKEKGSSMLRTEEITARIGDVLVAKLGISADSVVEMANIEMDLGATSLDMVETIMSLEDEFDIEISDRDAEGLKTVGDVIALVKKKF